jgi:endonuclease/exonuclease/phosphatase family metal-dependent hydrolase
VRTFGVEAGPGVPLITFTPYVALTAPVPVLVALVLRRWPEAAVGAVALIALAAAVLPRAFTGPRPAISGGVPLRVMASNVYEGRGDADTLVRLVRSERVDVLALEELTPEAVQRLEVAGLRRELPYGEVDARPGANGGALYSRLPLRRLPRVGSPDGNARPRVRIEPRGAPAVEIEAVHPPPPIHGDAGIWRAMLRELPSAGTGGALGVLLGDFNATLDHRELRRVLDRGYVDAADATGEGFRTTWPAGRRFPPEIAIDHVLADRRIAARSLSVHLVPRSDHRAVIAVLELPRAAMG